MKKQSPKAKRLTEVKRKHLKTVKRRQLSEIKKSIKKFQRLNENLDIKAIFDEYSDRFSDGVHHDNPSGEFTYEADEHLDPEMYHQEDVDKFQAMISHLQSQPGQSVSYSDHHSDRTFALTGNGDIHFTISWKGEDPLNEVKNSLKKSIRKLQRLNENERQGNYDRTLEVIKSFEDGKILQDFLRTFPKGREISKEDYFTFVFRKGHEPGTDDDYYARLNWKYIVSGDKSVYDDDDNRI